MARLANLNIAGDEVSLRAHARIGQGSDHPASLLPRRLLFCRGLTTANAVKPIGRVTIRTVAEDAGVSVAAVSKVLRNAYGVSDAMRSAVSESIDRLGYRPSVVARGMRGQTYTIGVLPVGIDNPFLPQVFAGIAAVAETAGYKVLMGVGAARMPLEATLVEQMIDNHMDG